jgi:hypothetical protein
VKRTIYTDGLSTNPLRIAEIWEGFDACRERDRPLYVTLPAGERWKLFPSGRAEKIGPDGGAA